MVKMLKLGEKKFFCFLMPVVGNFIFLVVREVSRKKIFFDFFDFS